MQILSSLAEAVFNNVSIPWKTDKCVRDGYYGMAELDRKEIVEDIKDLLDRLDDQIDEKVDEGKAGLDQLTATAREKLDSGAAESQDRIGELKQKLDELDDELDEKTIEGRERLANTISQIRTKLGQLEDRLRTD